MSWSIMDSETCLTNSSIEFSLAKSLSVGQLSMQVARAGPSDCRFPTNAMAQSDTAMQYIPSAIVAPSYTVLKNAFSVLTAFSFSVSRIMFLKPQISKNATKVSPKKLSIGTQLASTIAFSSRCILLRLLKSLLLCVFHHGCIGLIFCVDSARAIEDVSRDPTFGRISD